MFSVPPLKFHPHPSLNMPMENYSFRTFTSYPDSGESLAAWIKADFGLFWLFWSFQSPADTARFWLNRHELKPSWRESSRVGANLRKKKSSDAAPMREQPCRTPHPVSDSGAAPFQPRPCFIALKCLVAEPKLRPSMKEVLEKLKRFEAANERPREPRNHASHPVVHRQGQQPLHRHSPLHPRLDGNPAYQNSSRVRWLWDRKSVV